ncbi:MAG TPA: DUF3455 domain-containing protein [Chitinophagaceae bacterium]|nr:DUF3455 domain-containing protein [Chitinophagaceae bacterium]
MRKTITSISAGFALVATFTLVFTSCQKDQSSSYNNAELMIAAREASATPPSLTCGGSIPDILQVPEGNRLALTAYATGVQNYQVRQTGNDPVTYAWVNIGPQAVLYAKPDFTNEIGTHYGGPSWEFSKGLYKGEKVVAAKQKEVTPDPTAVAWLLLKTNDELSSAGNKITYIQRVCTSAGIAPSIPASESNLGQIESSSYTTTYLFYTKQ